MQKRVELESKIGYLFKNKELIEAAVVHKSLYHEDKRIKVSQERLEFFGDSLLNCLVAEYLMERYQSVSEGTLSKKRARLVDTRALNLYLDSLGIASFIRTCKGVSVSLKMKADFLEALLGAIYFDSGFDRAKEWFFFTFHSVVQKIEEEDGCDYKGLLQEYLQGQYQKKPEYRVLEIEDKGFLMGAFFEKELLATGFGISKKQGEMLAAKKALEVLGEKG